MINKVEICGVNTSKLPVLSNEEKQELLVKIKNGDMEVIYFCFLVKKYFTILIKFGIIYM